ncbi:conserved Plasmodium protein, unknown function [Plasmodium vivax]|uniref:Uncharacterized protein n=2 Tax=Plasmodium vivax TaxID=5855 RepID=A0A0J9SHI5_PLAVI|nr:hypothetical protein PVIIG_03297 [Plasmodium vivax India VII]CAG9481746.1 unnamed protein product [Plasmodium vivax]CAI7719282.1 conserved Plasmodium protein, unknown function [Plasmodium vivax]SCO71697.1 conserved Plasmodium protein, unknown function [Plasmodium vivax]VUZ94506.1 conserved Plasmodium protein, unknown function [Plasmodium vivax]
MKVRKRSPLCKRNPQGDKDEDPDGKLLEEYYSAIPGIELQIEKLLQSFHVNKYDYKITHLLIDIIQNETIKILRNAKNIKKNGIDRRLFIKADPSKREDRQGDQISPDLVGSSNDGAKKDGTKKDSGSAGVDEGQPRADQSKATTDISKDAGGADFKGGVIDDRAAQAATPVVAASPAVAATQANNHDGEGEKQNRGNDLQEGDGAGIGSQIGTQQKADPPVAQTQEQSQDKDGPAELPCGVEDSTKGEAAEGDKEKSQANLENGEEKKQVQVDVEEGQQKVGGEEGHQKEEAEQTGQTGQTSQTEQTAENFSIFKTFSSYFAKKSKPNEEDGGAPLRKEEESAPDKSGNGESKNGDPVEGAPKISSEQDKEVGKSTEQVQPAGDSPPGEVDSNVNLSENPAGAGSHVPNGEKENVKNDTKDTNDANGSNGANDTTKGEVPHGMSGSGRNLDGGDDAAVAPNGDQVEEAGKESNKDGGGIPTEKESNKDGSAAPVEKAPTEEPQNGGLKEGAKDPAEQPKGQPTTTTTTTEQEEVLVIDEESINLAIKEYVLKYIYKKKNVDFLYDELATQQKGSNSVGTVDRNVRYPTGFPPYLPDDCSINTILPAWDIKYNFNSSKGENYQ